MKTELCLVICFFVGVLIFYLLKQSCGCDTVVEGGGTNNNNNNSSDNSSSSNNIGPCVYPTGMHAVLGCMPATGEQNSNEYRQSLTNCINCVEEYNDLLDDNAKCTGDQMRNFCTLDPLGLGGSPVAVVGDGGGNGGEKGCCIVPGR